MGRVRRRPREAPGSRRPTAGTLSARLDGRVALVTGAANGIGREIARLFGAERAHVVVTDLEPDSKRGGAPTDELIRAAGGSAEFLHLDLANEATIEQVVARVAAGHDRLDVVVNNAATWTATPLLETSLADWERVLAVNVTGVFLVCRAAVRTMLTQSPAPNGVRGRIVNIASQYASLAVPGDVAYGTSKAAVSYLTKQIALDYVARGVVCNAVAPGRILCGKVGLDDDEASLARAKARTPYFRLGSPADVAQSVLFLASDDATFISGEILMVDGGWTAS
jgi:NAD(P)-dependent dehydrogenase (short-subunit alcohol dehydrogenase family)